MSHVGESDSWFEQKGHKENNNNGDGKLNNPKSEGEELGALNLRFRLQDLTLPEARQNDGQSLFVKTTVARSTQRPPK